MCLLVPAILNCQQIFPAWIPVFPISPKQDFRFFKMIGLAYKSAGRELESFFLIIPLRGSAVECDWPLFESIHVPDFLKCLDSVPEVPV